MMNDEYKLTWTELNSHANKVIVGKHCHILANTERHVDMNPFTPTYHALKAPIVDAAIQYDCPYDKKPYILVIRVAIYILSMMNKLVLSFVLREAGIVVNDKAKIHTVKKAGWWLLPWATEYSAITGFLSKVQKSFWSCTHVNSCQKYTLYINLIFY